MRILLCHNGYLQRGGEDVVFEAERDLLTAHGHDVTTYERNNSEIAEMKKIRAAAEAVWSYRSAREVGDLIDRKRPQVVHVHNSFPLISPSVLRECRVRGIPVVLTLHNYRLACVNGLFLRANAPCEMCLGRTIPWPAVWHGCYRGSRTESAVAAAALSTHNLTNAYVRSVSLFVAPTDFVRGKMETAGVPPERIVVKPHFLTADPGLGAHESRTLLFVGRLAQEKGIRVVMEAWSRRDHTRGWRLQILGDGPLHDEVVAFAQANQDVEFLGHTDRANVTAHMRQARYLIAPSIVYETFGLTVIEALATGLPVLVSAGGASSELVTPHRAGFAFPRGDADALADLLDHAPLAGEVYDDLASNARRAYRQHFTAERNYELLLDVYEKAQAA